MSLVLSSFIEDATQGLLDSITTHLPDALVQTWAKYQAKDSARGLTVPLPETVTYLYGAHSTLGTNRPLVLVYNAGGTPRVLGQQQTTTGWMEWRFTTFVTFFVVSDQAEVAQRMHDRFAEAILLSCLPYQDNPGPGFDVIPQRLVPVRQAGTERGSRWEISVGVDMEY